jgi:hypothetical protein
MNIFVLDENPVLAAQHQCDKHVVKMVLESAQLLSTAHRLCNDDPDESVYKATHTNHPCSLWVRAGDGNYLWLYEHFLALADEYTHRYNKVHKSFDKLAGILCVVPLDIPDGSTPFVRCGPTANGTIVDSYRQYYREKQGQITMTWTKRNKPEWMEKR